MVCQVKVVLQHDEDGYYAYAPELKGCQTQGDTLEEALANIREAVEVYLDSLAPAERSALLSPHGI
jgi:predicted RNase H-like HicB family nuclease